MVGFGISDSFEIVSDTLETTSKAINLRQNPNVAFVIWGFIPGTVQYKGIADEPSGTDLLIGSNERSSSVRIVRDSFVSHSQSHSSNEAYVLHTCIARTVERDAHATSFA